ncbi:YoaK family protein [Phaeacidiphilus oryzae]|uniref:YoaK family protein n=1 Tax=Phaeacidiphilus oryzae TaxID=348818 RepID=UPI0007C7A38A|nr:YoaK family protein [Phaeacidiphilus oryzae]
MAQQQHPETAPQPGVRPPATTPLLAVALAYLTFLSGFLDAVSYLGLGRVFTANMTGNVVVLGFAAGGAPGFSVPGTAISAGGFLLGAALGGRLVRHRGPAPRWMDAAIAVEAAGTALGGAFELLGLSHYLTILVLALAMGCRNAAVRSLGVADVTTTVLTGTLTSIAADSRLAGGGSTRLPRRVGSVLAMLLGAMAGAYLLRTSSVAVCLLAAAAADLVLLFAYIARNGWRPAAAAAQDEP